MTEHYLTLSEGVAYDENSLPEPCHEPDYPLEIDLKNGWLHYEDIDDASLRGQAIEIAGVGSRFLCEWVNQYKSPQIGVIRNKVWALCTRPEILPEDQRSIAGLARALHTDKQRIHTHVKSFRARFGVHRLERTAEGRKAMSEAMLASYARRKSAADGNSEPQEASDE